MRRASIPFSIERPFTKIPSCTVRVELRMQVLIIQFSYEEPIRSKFQFIESLSSLQVVLFQEMIISLPFESLNIQGVIPLHAFLSSLHFYLYTSFTANSASKDNLYNLGFTGQAFFVMCYDSSSSSTPSARSRSSVTGKWETIEE